MGVPVRAASLLAVLALAAAAGAQTARPVRLRYEAPAGCPDADAFLAAVRQRAPGARLASPGEPARSYGVSIINESGTFVGRLSLDGTPEAREVRGDSCEETVAALAFVTSLAVSASEPAASSAPSARIAPSASLASSGSAPIEPTPERSWDASVGAGALASGAFAPGVSFGAEVAGEVVLPVALAPSLRLAGSYGASGSVDAGPGQASFRLLAARLDGCPVSASLGSLRLVPCVGYEIGSLRAQGTGVDLPAGGSRSWHAVHLAGRAHWRFTGRWYVELTVGLVLPLTSRSFVFDIPPTDIFSVPRVAGSGALGAGVHFL